MVGGETDARRTSWGSSNQTRVKREGKLMAEQERPSLGGQFDALWRQGLKDLQANLIPAFPQADRSVSEPGTPLNPTPQMVTQELGQGSYESLLASYASRGEPEQDKDRGIEH